MGLCPEKENHSSKSKEIALCLIDWQRFYVDPDSPAFIPETAQIVNKLLLLTGIFQELDLPILATRHGNSSEKPNNFLRFYGRVINRDSHWSSLADPVSNIECLNLFSKETYSIFENPQFSDFLVSMGIKKIVLAGLQTDRCILANVIAGFDRGFEMIVVSEACASRNKFRHRAALNLIRYSFASVLKINELLKTLKIK